MLVNLHMSYHINKFFAVRKAAALHNEKFGSFKKLPDGVLIVPFT